MSPWSTVDRPREQLRGIIRKKRVSVDTNITLNPLTLKHRCPPVLSEVISNVLPLHLLSPLAFYFLFSCTGCLALPQGMFHIKHTYSVLTAMQPTQCQSST